MHKYYHYITKNNTIPSQNVEKNTGKHKKTCKNITNTLQNNTIPRKKIRNHAKILPIHHKTIQYLVKLITKLRKTLSNFTNHYKIIT